MRRGMTLLFQPQFAAVVQAGRGWPDVEAGHCRRLSCGTKGLKKAEVTSVAMGCDLAQTFVVIAEQGVGKAARWSVEASRLAKALAGLQALPSSSPVPIFPST